MPSPPSGTGIVPGRAIMVETQTGGCYFALPGATTNNLTPSGLHVSPSFISKTVTTDRIGLQVIQAGGGAGSTLRLGIYADDGSMRRAALILDAGTIAADSTTNRCAFTDTPPSITSASPQLSSASTPGAWTCGTNTSPTAKPIARLRARTY
jgi:hypothetical protein